MEEILERMNKLAANAAPLGNTAKFQLGDEVIYIDGTGDSNVVSQDDKDAATLILISQDDFVKLLDGNVHPTMAMMTGKLKVKGDMGVAMKLTQLIS